MISLVALASFWEHLSKNKSWEGLRKEKATPKNLKAVLSTWRWGNTDPNAIFVACTPSSGDGADFKNKCV